MQSLTSSVPASQDATEPAALTAALVETAQHGLALLQRSVSTKLPRPASNSWMADFQHHFADLHLPMFQSQQHLKQDEIAACKVRTDVCADVLPLHASRPRVAPRLRESMQSS